MNIATTDHDRLFSAADRSRQDLLAYAARKSGRSVFDIFRDFRRMASSHGRLNLVEYVRYGLFDASRHTAEERGRFVSNDLHWPVALKCSNQGWHGAAEDKFLAATLLRSGGLPVPDTIAAIDRSPRAFPGVPKIGTPADLDSLLAALSGERLFCKVVDDMMSLGAFRIDAYGDGEIRCAGHDPMHYAAFLSDFVGDKSYLVQRELVNHSAIRPYATALATVRMVNMVADTGVICPTALIKLPQGGNVADAFWRPGNLAGSLDVDSGRVLTVARRGIEIEYLTDHPERPGLIGMHLPFWDRVRDINERAARIFAPIRYQSTDIAITQDGPVIIELNFGSAFDMPQYASGRGLLTPEVRHFFASCGYAFDTPRKRRFLTLGS